MPDAILDEEIAVHLRPSGTVGTAGRAVRLAREPARRRGGMERDGGPAQLPPPGLPTDIVIADRVDPPFIDAAFLAACANERADSVRIHHADCEHMVLFLEPGLDRRSGPRRSAERIIEPWARSPTTTSSASARS